MPLWYHVSSQQHAYTSLACLAVIKSLNIVRHAQTTCTTRIVVIFIELLHAGYI